ncbi:type II toxin-antitoxin system HipA family toxin [Ideonella sp. TBM-1]|uniref:Type II toxin-antitoxin system HipA family toxin n=1 Tax=Ideonella livida TaxID=2707176 RepID=A0A7C9PIN2_9BURK|nr:type II toxin-antitoxin system HipA family toxin [Ideonella livida]
MPVHQYQAEGGPNLAQCFELLRRATRPSAPAVLHLLDAVAFNALVGNHVPHGKNFSLPYAPPGSSACPNWRRSTTCCAPPPTPGCRPRWP